MSVAGGPDHNPPVGPKNLSRGTAPRGSPSELMPGCSIGRAIFFLCLGDRSPAKLHTMQTGIFSATKKGQLFQSQDLTGCPLVVRWLFVKLAVSVVFFWFLFLFRFHFPPRISIYWYFMKLHPFHPLQTCKKHQHTPARARNEHPKARLCADRKAAFTPLPPPTRRPTPLHASPPVVVVPASVPSGGGGGGRPHEAPAHGGPNGDLAAPPRPLPHPVGDRGDEEGGPCSSWDRPPIHIAG